MIRKFFLGLAVTSLALGTCGCNTVRGVGQDLESAADTVDKAT